MTTSNRNALRYSPGGLGFRMPAEWERHERTWMAWPNRQDTYPHDFVQAKREFASVAHTIRRYEPVAMVVDPADIREAKDHLGSDVEIVEFPVNDSWARDTGPCFVINNQGELAGVDLIHNCWGGNYEPFDDDAKLARRILRHLDVPHFSSQLTAEGGGINVDGDGTMVTTESCLLNANRNPGWTKADIEEEVEYLFGITKVLWVPGFEAETESDGHVDGIAAFVGPAKILVEYNSNLNAPDAALINANAAALDGQTDAKGRKIDVVRIDDAGVPGVDPIMFCQTYINHYIINGAIIVPKYNTPGDDRVKEVFNEVFPDRDVAFVEINNIAAGCGGIHCITQQQPVTGTS